MDILLAQAIDLNLVEWIQKVGPTGLLAVACVVLWRRLMQREARLDQITNQLMPFVQKTSKAQAAVAKAMGAPVGGEDDDGGS